MTLHSTLNPTSTTSWRDAVLRGLAPDGGLFLPTTLPTLSEGRRAHLATLTFPELASEISALFLKDEVPVDLLKQISSAAFTFDLPMREIAPSTFILELFHGPTCAFKDFGARFMSHLFRYFLGAEGAPLTVLVATSGDTGSAVANAFLDYSPNPRIKVAILFPKGKVSVVQEKQMTTLGKNVSAFEVDGTFDDCQRLVKQALADNTLTKQTQLTSANSINIARLLPQMFYYIYAGLQLSRRHSHSTAPIFSIPSGNLGNITGGLLASIIGLPVSQLIAACNANAAFPHYLQNREQSGELSPQPSRETLSNAMDVGNPSNFSRIASLCKQQALDLPGIMSGFSISDAETLECMTRCYSESGYVLDPHTAVGLRALELYREGNEGCSSVPAIVLATAHPAKFSSVVESAIGSAPQIPQQLQGALSAKGYKISLDNCYDSLRQQLLSL